MNPRDQELSTADLVRPRDDVRARHDERMSGRALDSPAPEPAPLSSPPPSVEGGARHDVRTAAERPALFPGDEADGLRNRWADIQTSFVDEPRRAVEQADSLVAETMKRMAEVFARERANLEGQWDRGDQVNTEDLRLALQRYRAFFDRLLSF